MSNSFWNTLSSKLPALLLAEVLASLAFVAIVSVLIAQGKFLFDVTVASDCRRQKNSARGTNQSSIDLVKLLFCISIDVLGSSNEVIPLVGEVVDVIYAPIAALLLRQLFQGSNVIFLLEFTEEILPFTDIVPLATICWVVETFFGSSDLARVLKIADFSPNGEKLILKQPPRESSIKDADIIVPSSKDREAEP